MLSGVVPAMIYYGLEVLDPKIFLFATTIVCAIVSIATGSSWSTVATVGVALLGIGQALDVHTGMTIGAVISGALFWRQDVAAFRIRQTSPRRWRDPTCLPTFGT